MCHISPLLFLNYLNYEMFKNTTLSELIKLYLVLMIAWLIVVSFLMNHIIKCRYLALKVFKLPEFADFNVIGNCTGTYYVNCENTTSLKYN